MFSWLFTTINNLKNKVISSEGEARTKSPPRNTSEKNVNQGVKRKDREDAEESPKTKKTALNYIDFTQDDDKMASSSVDNVRAEFEAKYVQENQLGEGGCGSIFAGYRKGDNFPVAIKYVPDDKVYCTHTDDTGNEISAEVDIMLTLRELTTGVGTSAPVSLLDWYNLGHELILVLERPVPSTDLLNYIQDNGGSIEEDEAKIIVKQLVDAAKELEDKCIFHRDIKVENILIETGSRTPRLRLIDFGLSCFIEEDSHYSVFYGTPTHVPPEWLSRKTYYTGPTTVWQVGVVLYESVHRNTNFMTQKFTRNEQKIRDDLSEKCQDFLKGCLALVPEERPTLEQLHQHPWFRYPPTSCGRWPSTLGLVLLKVFSSCFSCAVKCLLMVEIIGSL